jgi:1-acyl-sn-glycerol-3-phosphate acyltransferase
MLDALRQRNPGRSIPALLFYELAVNTVRLVFVLLYRRRVANARACPEQGPVLVVANHQSHFDPPCIGSSLSRHVCFVARAGLFKQPAFARLIGLLNAFPIKDDGGSDTAAIRTALDILKQRRVLLIFPEGTRSSTGEIQPFKRGAWLLLSRAKCTVLPAAIDGAFDAWPRSRKFPRLFSRPIRVRFGQPIAYETLAALGPDQGLARLEQEVRALHQAIKTDAAS